MLPTTSNIKEQIERHSKRFQKAAWDIIYGAVKTIADSGGEVTAERIAEDISNIDMELVPLGIHTIGDIQYILDVMSVCGIVQKDVKNGGKE